MASYQYSRFPEVKLKDVQAALSELVLPADDLLTGALAVMSQRSLFVFGPPGNGKTSLARLLHGVHRECPDGVDREPFQLALLRVLRKCANLPLNRT